MSLYPLRLRALPNGEALAVNDSGSFFTLSPAALERFERDTLNPQDEGYLTQHGHSLDENSSFDRMSHAYCVAERLDQVGTLDYLILVPTLRCNLRCSYCQVSRADIDQHKYDWSPDTLAAVLDCIDAIQGDHIKIEFQGGEPSLRPDLIQAVIERCERFAHRQFVVCTNLQCIDDGILTLFDRPDCFISTSLDGDTTRHAIHRTQSEGKTRQFFDNLRYVVERYGPGKVSALPTIDASDPPPPESLIDAYREFGLDSIFLRPINYQGFARKRHKHSREQSHAWRRYYRRFVETLIERNWSDRDQVLEESYLSICLRRIFWPGNERHVDLRNPNPMGMDYIVVDHDGTVYPTDEARMLARSGIIDLAIGDIVSGWDSERRETLNRHATNQFDPTCQHCAYQPFCGRDLIDDLARYGRIDVPRTETEFCRRHLHLFDFIFELIYSDDPAVRYSLTRWLRLPETPVSFGTMLE